MNNSYNPHQQYAEWKKECEEIAGYDFERVERQLQDNSYAVERDSTPVVEEHSDIKAEILSFQDFVERKKRG